jgi:hypothetical protein
MHPPSETHRWGSLRVRSGLPRDRRSGSRASEARGLNMDEVGPCGQGGHGGDTRRACGVDGGVFQRCVSRHKRARLTLPWATECGLRWGVSSTLTEGTVEALVGVSGR